jgi:hypothetical protein
MGKIKAPFDYVQGDRQTERSTRLSGRAGKSVLKRAKKINLKKLKFNIL